MNKYVMDAYAWIEYFKGSDKGEKIKSLFKDENHEFFTHKVTFSEVISVTKRQSFDPEEASRDILSLSKLYEGDIEFFKETGLLHADLRRKIKNFGLADTFVLHTAQRLGAKVITGDPHFKGFKGEVIFIG